MKKYFLGVLTGFIACTMLVSAVAIANVPIKLIVNGREVVSDVPPQIISGRTMIPARPLAEALGAKVEWDEKNYAVVVTGGVQAGAVPMDLEPVKEQGVEKNRKMDARDNNPPGNASWLEGFRINGTRIETRSTIDTPGIHAMGFVTLDNFYLEESILNNVLSDMGLPTVQHRYPSPDIWFNAWYFISLKDVPNIDFVYNDKKMDLIVWDKSKPRPLSDEEKVEEFIPSEWVVENELGRYGLTVKLDEKVGKYHIGNNKRVIITPNGFANDKSGKVFNMDIRGEDFRFRMLDGKLYVNKKDLGTFSYFDEEIVYKTIASPSD